MGKKLKNVLTFCLVTALILCTCGCGAKEASESNEILPEKNPSLSTVNYEFLKEEELVWKDNSLDEYQAVFNLSIEEPPIDAYAGEMFGGDLLFLSGANSAVRFKTHIFSNYRKSWSGVTGSSSSGEKFSGRIVVNSEFEGAQIDDLGFIAGVNGYVASRSQYENDKVVGLRLYTLNEAFEKTGEIEDTLPFDKYVWAIAGDGQGNYHVILNSFGKYVVISPEGEILFESERGMDYPWLYALDDGRVVVIEEYENGKHQLEGWNVYEVDLEHGDLKEIQKIRQSEVSLARMQCPPLVTIDGNNTPVCCDKGGVYIYDLQEKKRRTIYKWSRHGISVKEFKSIYAGTDGSIGIIYKDNDGIQYILLKPKFEDVEIKNIEFAVSPWHKDIYYDAVAAFNKKYPIYAIEFKDDYEETPLLTKLGSGAGPVIIDTAITGFDALEKLWQPLDGFLEKSGLADELYPQALAFGQIGDNTYGIVTHFYFETLVAKDRSLLGWDYDAYLNAVENFDGSVFANQYVFEPTDYRRGFLNSLTNGIHDSAFLNAEEGTVVFGTPEFKRILTLTEKANPCLPAEEGRVLQESKTLCEMVLVNNVRRLLTLRMRLENGDVINVGYPTSEGARPMLVADNPIVIRSTATEEEKQIAYTFLKILLSHDSAMITAADNMLLYSGDFSVRKEMLEEQMKQHNRIHEYNDDPEIDVEKEKALFEELLNTAVVKKSFPATLQSVFDEEIGLYLDGEIPAELLDSRLKSRVSLYLDENE